MTGRQQQLLIANGAIVFLLGMASGFPLAFELLGRFELWPLPLVIEFDMPGDTRGWVMAHLEGILNGVLLIAIAAVADRLALSARAGTIIFWGLLVTAYGNMAASIISPLFDARGLSFGGVMNSIVYLLFVAAIIAIVWVMVLVVIGALKRS